MIHIRLALTLAVLPLAALADARNEDGGAAGTLNPEEMTLARVLDDVARGQTTMTNCAAGYFITKSGRHAEARQVFEPCAEAGYAGAMTWMAQLDDNGLGAPEDPAAAASWDRRAAEAGDPVGQFNLGLDLLRGRGVAADTQTGRRLVDAAAAQGYARALTLQASGYDPEAVTPDADRWKYGPRLY